jgi:hypothetical protein
VSAPPTRTIVVALGDSITAASALEETWLPPTDARLGRELGPARLALVNAGVVR